MRLSFFSYALVLLVLLAFASTRPALAQSSSRTGVLVIAHGAGENWNTPVVAAVDRAGRTMPAAVGFLMGKGPTPQQAYDALVALGATRIVVVPLLISSHSAHAEQIRFLGGTRADYPHTEHMHLEQLRGKVPVAAVTGAMDDDPIVAAILADHARALSRDSHGETLVLVAHGPDDDEEAAQWIAVMARLAERIKAAVPFRRIEPRLLRDDAPKPVKDRALADLRETVATRGATGRVVVVPLLLSPGSVANEIPAALEGLDFAWDGRTLLPDDRIADWILSRANAAQPRSQSSAFGGSVVDANGLAVPGAAVVLRNRRTGFQRITRSGTDGTFDFAAVPHASYDVIATLAGFAPAVLRVDVPRDAPTSLILVPAAYQEAVTVVSDARSERLRDGATAAVTVLGGEAMRDAAYTSVAEALHEVAGAVTRRGSEGADVGGEQVQGVDSRQVLVLIDGQPIVGARGIKSGVINLDRQGITGLDRIEVVKGAVSALYGSDAMGGVINLIPRDPRRPIEGSAQISGGNDGAFDTDADVGGMTPRATFFLSAGRHQRDGFDLTPSTLDTTGAAFHREDTAARATFAPSNAWLVAATATSYWSTSSGRSVGELGAQADRTPSTARTLGFRADWRASPRTTAELRAYTGRYDETSTGVLLNAARTPLDPGRLHEGLVKLDASVDRSLGERQRLRGGAEWIRDEYRGRNRLRDPQGNDAATGVLWAQHEFTPLRALGVTSGVRVDDHSVFGNAISPKLAAVLHVRDSVSARASYGRGFRAPDLGQLFYRFLNPTNRYQVIGNPALNPERSSSWQAGLEIVPGTRSGAGITVFRNDITNLIQAVNLGFMTDAAQLAAVSSEYQIDPAFNVQLNRSLYMYENVAHARTRGLEFSGHTRVGAPVRIGGTYAYLEAVDAATGARLANRNRHQGTFRADWTPARLGIRANLRGAFYSSWIAGTTRSTAGSTNVTAPGFALWDATVSKAVWRSVDAFAAVDNLANSQDPNTARVSTAGAALPIYRPEIGRTWRGGLRWTLSR